MRLRGTCGHGQCKVLQVNRCLNKLTEKKLCVLCILDYHVLRILEQSEHTVPFPQ